MIMEEIERIFRKKREESNPFFSLKTVASSILNVLSLDNGDTITNPNDTVKAFKNCFASIAETTKQA